MARVLVIDDDSLLRRMMCRVLAGAGHQVVEAGDGDEGLRQFAQSPADVVVTDIFMPRTEGIETVRELRRRSPAVRVLAISGGGQQVSGLDVLAFIRTFGADAVLQKPFRPAELLDCIARLLSGTPDPPQDR